MESNPKILNGFCERVGVVGGWSFVDVLGLDPELLSFVPQPAVAVCLLFPSKAIRKPRLESLEGQEASRRAPASTFYLVQHKEFGNACGTIAAVHAIGNLVKEGMLQLARGSPMEKFLASAAEKSPDDVGRELADATELHEASEQAAKSRDAQTRTPDRDEKVDGHFVVFVQVQGHLVELDGCMGFPIDHGNVSPATFLGETARVIREEFMARAPGNPNFSVMALTAQMDCDIDVTDGTTAGMPSDDQVAALVAMGFEESLVRKALQETGGDADAAVGILCG